MRIVQYLADREVHSGVWQGGHVFDTGYADTLALIRDGDRGLDRAAEALHAGHDTRFERLVAPLTNPGKTFGSGVNYRSHGDEEPGFEFPIETPWDFIKLSSAIIGPDEPIIIPPTDDIIKRQPGGHARFSEYGFAVDYEVEFGVIIGRTAKHVRREDALDHIWGYTVFNDAGSRSVQFFNGQRDLGKNSMPSAPWAPTDWTETRSRTTGTCRSGRL